MANPQAENGHARIANELLEALSRINLSPYEWRVLMYIFRKTYGWSKKSDVISVSQIASGTGLQRPHACRAKASLVAKNVLQMNGEKVGLNKDYDTWNVTSTGTVPKSVTNSDSKPKTQKRYQQRHSACTGLSVTGTGNESLPAEALQKKENNSTTTKLLKSSSGLFGPPADGGKKQKISPEIQQVFEAWNQHAGKSVNKPNGQGTAAKITWKGHTKLGKEKVTAIRQALKDYSVDEIVGGIANFATVLLSREYFWSYPWTLDQFLTRGRERHKGAERQWWQFLPDNFDAERYRRHGAESEVVFEDPSIEEAEAIARRLDRQAEERESGRVAV